MKIKVIISLLVTMFVFTFLSFGQLAILSGPEQASYNEFGNDIVTVLSAEFNNEVTNVSTSGAAYNFNQLADPDSPYKIALIQSDYLYFMQGQDSRDNTAKTKDIKVVLPLANEEIHLVTKASIGIRNVEDLYKRSIAIGTKDQGTYATATMMKEKTGVEWISRNIYFEDAMNELNMDRIQAFFIVSSAPIEKLDVNPQAMMDELALVPLDNYKDWAKYYDRDTIYAKDYKWLNEDVPTYSVKTLLVVNESKLSEDDKILVNRLKLAIMNKYDEFKKSGHPKWKEVKFNSWSDSDWPMFK
jgi:TRAP transporter TAXI family solute receptor